MIFILHVPDLYCPKSVLEAMSCGLCVLAYDSPGINDIVINKSTGLLLRPNPSIASQQIREFINDKPLIDRIKNATQTIIRLFINRFSINLN